MIKERYSHASKISRIDFVRFIKQILRWNVSWNLSPVSRHISYIIFGLSLAKQAPLILPAG